MNNVELTAWLIIKMSSLIVWAITGDRLKSDSVEDQGFMIWDELKEKRKA